MSFNKKFIKTLSLTAGLMLSASSFAATWNIAVGDGGGSAQEALGLKFSELLSEKKTENTKVNYSLTVN